VSVGVNVEVRTAVPVGVNVAVPVKVNVSVFTGVTGVFVGTIGVFVFVNVFVGTIGVFVFVNVAVGTIGVLVGELTVQLFMTRYCFVNMYMSTSSDGANHMFFAEDPSP
jgi:hypothetical protein